MKRTALLISLLSVNFLAAQKDSIVGLPAVEVTSIRAGQTAPFTKTNITKSEIEKNNLGQDLPFMLDRTPSVVVNSDAGNGFGYTGIRIRGTDATRINVTLNGIPFNDPESGGTFFVNLPDFLSSTSSIQIQRGVGTSSNGGGAFGATINLGTNENNTKKYLELNNTIGSFNTIKNTVKFGSGLLGKHFLIDGRVSRISSDGYVDRASSKLRSFYLSTAWLDDKNTIRLNAFTGDEKTYQAWYGILPADLISNRTFNSAGTEKSTTDPYKNETDNYTQDHLQLFYTRKLSASSHANVGLFYIHGRGYYEQYKASQRYIDYGMKPQLTGSTLYTHTDLVRQLWLDNDFFGGIFSLQFKKDRSDFTIGGAVTNYLGDHFGKVIWAENGPAGERKYYDLDATKTDHNLYAKLEQKLSSDFRAYIDLQGRTVSHEINGFRNNPALSFDTTYFFFNPKAGISYFKGNWSAFVSYSIANREPNRDDFEAGINEQPKPEQLHDIELNLAWKNNKSALSITSYLMNYKNQLVLTGKINDVGAYTRTNIPESYRAGIELEAGTTLTSFLKLTGNVTISKNQVKNFTEYLDDYDNGGQLKYFYKESALAFSPSTIASATITAVPLKNLAIDLTAKYVGRQYLDNTENESRSLEAYHTQDIQASYRFSKSVFSNVEIIARVNNLWDTRYEPNGYTFSWFENSMVSTASYYFPMAGRNYLVGLNIKL